MLEARVDLSKHAENTPRLTWVSELNRLRAGFSLAEHYHQDLWQGDWVISGELTFYVRGEEITLGPGEVLFIPPGLEHRLFSRVGLTTRAIKFEAAIRTLDERPIRV
ncbi:MAG TPA: cupin domain-containing protein, partial [Limnochordia bacterium]